MIYLIVDPIRVTCKIGYSENPRKRLKSLKTSSPYPLILAGIKDGSIADEKLLHDKFSQYFIQGEWFVFSDAIKKEFNCSHHAGYGNVELFHGFNETLARCGITAIKILIFSMSTLEPDELKICTNSSFVKSASEFIGVGSRMIQEGIYNLIEQKIFLKEWRGNYYINPLLIYKGSSFQRIEYIMDFYRIGLI